MIMQMFQLLQNCNNNRRTIFLWATWYLSENAYFRVAQTKVCEPVEVEVEKAMPSQYFISLVDLEVDATVQLIFQADTF